MTINETDCPVASLAAIANQLMRVHDLLDEANGNRSGDETVAHFSATHSGVSDLVNVKQRALENFALVMPAKSQLGALFQLGVALTELDGLASSGGTPEEFREIAERLAVGLQSAFDVWKAATDVSSIARVLEYYSGGRESERLEALLLNPTMPTLKVAS
jgi:hypothetical protein